MEEKNPRVQRGSDRARTENRSGGSPRRGEKAPRANGNENGQGNKKTRTYKHVQLEHKRPQLSKAGEGGQRAASNRGDQSARRNFASPKKDPNATLKIIPLGGLDAIGKNMTVFECKGDMILDDAGLMFPDDNHPGVDLILPDYTYVLENADKLRGIVITHGHEDHTGTLPYLMKDLDRNVPIYGTKMTLGLIEGKFAEHKIKNAKLVEIKPGDQIKLGCFTAEFFAVNHSIPGAVGVFFQSPAGNVLHTGDFKLDQTPIDGVTGRSMIQNTDIARRLGYLSISDTDLIDAYDLKGIPPEQVVIMCTGSQGEPLSALARIANGEHRTIQMDEGDTVIVSATPVPGNEKAVTRVINGLAKIGADVYDKNRARVHVSGHAGAEELKLVLSIVQPKAFMPVHGEATHLRAHARLAEATGVPTDNVFICENGESLELTSQGVVRGETVQSGIVFVDGLSVGDTSQGVLDERNALGSQGFAAIAAAVSPKGKNVVGNVQIEMHGITGGDDDFLVREAQGTVKNALGRAMGKGGGQKEWKKAGRDALLSLLWERTKTRPMVIVNLLEV